MPLSILKFPNAPDAPNVTIGDAIKRYRRLQKARVRDGELRRRSIDRELPYLRSFRRRYGRQGIPDFRKAERQLKRWLKRNPQWDSPNTKLDALRAILGCFRTAAEQGWIDANPYRRPRRLKLKQRSRPAIFAEEFKRLMDAARAARGRWQARRAFRLAAYFLGRTGARTCEMRDVLWSDFDEANCVVTLDESRSKTGELRTIGLDARLMRLLRWMRRRRSPALSDSIFTSAWGATWKANTFQQSFRRYADAAGLEKRKTAYSLRHGFCVTGLEKHIGVRQLADQMGHVNSRMIDHHYGKEVKKRQKYLCEIVERVNKKS